MFMETFLSTRVFQMPARTNTDKCLLVLPFHEFILIKDGEPQRRSDTREFIIMTKWKTVSADNPLL